ncbi:MULTISPECIES: ArsR/SmtB family transcription factor [Clostridium]|uniref:HTH-type transcriptional repressor SmtB n=2 Tax=Clostridium TaxID=1485 RepID=A0A151ARV8_9CLOT|nr:MULTISPECIES: metalloregulator ArsR/SmtB family transcription factor [Clostridium]KYH30345.1 HTH-type transcriptional repressor SmtB [Clostridium colicanis DSM 13634]MBE6044434.1 winged helix-turn-helix transcriptional regulator [Clostridium thermopalmarium]PRR69458.1 HTH-type transcriptional repressor SmtB [Clostridium thermopalmarium DSM 5974]PVZ26276.1 DNA-binding transcriptional ArsR family regulator [Clostridium thermopalmarium DSM 5974]
MDNDFEKYDSIAELLKAIAHPVRLCIIKGLIKKGKCNVSHMQNCLDIPQPTVSRHLQMLKNAGIIKGERNGLEINYTVCNKKVIEIINLLFDEKE